MPRKPLIRCNSNPYHVTSRANNREWFTLPMDEVWGICLDTFKEANFKHKIELISFVLMSNHYHMMVRTPDANLDLFMYEFNKRLAFKLRDTSTNINHLLGGRYKWCLIKNNHYLYNCYRYVYQNPLRASLASRCEEYPYSTLNCLVYNREFSIPIFDQLGFKDPYMLNWLNSDINEDELVALKNGLYRSELVELKLRQSRRFL